MPKLFIPQQFIELDDHADRWMGSIDIGGVDFRIELYPPESKELIDDLYAFAECGDELCTIEFEGQSCLLAVMPKGA